MIPAYSSLIYSHLQYAIICWGGTFKKCIRKLQVKQNRIEKLYATNLKKKTKPKPLYEKLQFLKINGVYKFEVAKFISKVYLNKLPEFCGDQGILESCLQSTRILQGMLDWITILYQKLVTLTPINRLRYFMLKFGTICPVNN